MWKRPLVFSCLSQAIEKSAMRPFLPWSAWALHLLWFPQKVDGPQGTRLEHIYIYEAPEPWACHEVEEQCTQPLRPWVAGPLRTSRQTAPVSFYTLRSGLSPTLLDQQVLGCILLAHIRLEEAPVVKKSPKCGVHPLLLLKKMPDRCHWPPGGEARKCSECAWDIHWLTHFSCASVDGLCAFLFD